MPFVSDQVELLLQGVDGASVVENVRRYYNTDYSFEKNVSNIRRLYLKRTVRHPCFEHDLQAIVHILHSETFPDKNKTLQAFDQFSKMTIEDQYDVLHKSTKNLLFSHCTNANERLKQLKLLPENFYTLKLSEEDHKSAQQNKNLSLLHRNLNIIKLCNSYEVLNTHVNILKFGSRNKIDEIMSLIFVSGRRETEILNGKSEFHQIDHMPFHAKFIGVLKKKKQLIGENITETLIIPLLCEFTTFKTAFDRMRGHQSDDIQIMTNKQISNRYCSQLLDARKKAFPTLTKTHDLRALYVKFANIMFQHNLAFPLFCMVSLGHDVIQDTLHYMTTSIEEDERLLGVNGYLFENEFPQFKQ